MRLARPVVVVLFLLLALAPAASAHDEGEVDHRDTPADLAGADINRALAVSGMARTVAPDLPQYLPTTWCGSRQTSDDTAHAAFPATQRQIKVIYAYAFGEPDNSAQWRNALQTNVSRIEQYLALQTGGRRALRFDMGTECGPQYVDLQVVELPQARSAYLDQFEVVADDVRDAVGRDNRDVFVLADNLTADAYVYGTGEVWDDDRAGAVNLSNDGGLNAIMWTTADTQPSPWDWQPTVMLHEITHNLGGVQQSAPHSTAGSHCWDGADVMCYDDNSAGSEHYTGTLCPTSSSAIPQTFDCGHDDYFNPDPAPGSYLAANWNVYTSAFLAPCTQLGMACGDDVVPTVPVNTAVPTVAGAAQRGLVLGASTGTWLNTPTGYVVQWQRAVGAAWGDIAGATAASYSPTSADVGAPLRVTVTASNADGAAIVASAGTAPVADSTTVTPPAPKPTRSPSMRIALRDRARHTKGTLTAKVVVVAAGREVRTAAATIALPTGTWRLRLCAGPKRGALRCVLTTRVRTRKRAVRLPAARVLILSTTGAVRVTAAVVDRRSRTRVQGKAASA